LKFTPALEVYHWGGGRGFAVYGSRFAVLGAGEMIDVAVVIEWQGCRRISGIE
jgi:hypothetical protein